MTYAGIDQPITAIIHAIAEPNRTPYCGNAQILTIAYTATLTPPNIIGPAAPLGTVGPCAIHNATMLVKKIAGNTAAIPATSGWP
jgi:hypothetical protein